MPRKPQPEHQVLAPLTDLQRQAAALLADGATDERVAAELAVPLAWVQGLEGSLPVAAEVTRHQWRRYQGHRQRIRSLVERALDVATEELEQRPTAELAVALLRALKVEAPEAPHRTAEQLLRSECETRAEADLREREAIAGIGAFGFISPADVTRTAVRLFESEAHRLSAPADPEPVA
jgi:hypothetical protein